jgi:hypothetical protein
VVIIDEDGRQLAPQQKLEALQDIQASLFDNLNRPFDRIYVILRHTDDDIDFEVVHPVIPDYLWSSDEGIQLRSLIDRKLLCQYSRYIPEKPTAKSLRALNYVKMDQIMR